LRSGRHRHALHRPLAGLAHGDVTLTAHPSALHRPMGEMIKALREIGADIDDGGTWSLPFTVRGRGHIRGGEVTIDASGSSQFVSGLLLAAPRFDVGLHLIHSGERLPVRPPYRHDHRDARASRHPGRAPHPNEWVVPAGTLRGRDAAIEPDLSNAAPFLAAAMLTEGSVTIPGGRDLDTARSAPPEILSLLGGRAAAAAARSP
jgi:3-phosphoshikimate 1-carboxyvinyltransferase